MHPQHISIANAYQYTVLFFLMLLCYHQDITTLVLLFTSAGNKNDHKTIIIAIGTMQSRDMTRRNIINSIYDTSSVP